MKQWYVSQQGKAVGPLDQEKIVDMIHRGELGHLDLVFATGGTDWKPLAEYDEFAKYLNQAQSAAALPSEAQGAEWVLLKKVKTDEESQFQQMGPFSVAQVLRLLEQGEVRFVDFAWREGLESWVRISEVEEFNLPLPSSPPIDRELYGSDKTQAENTEALETETMTESAEDRSRLSQLIQIEKFDAGKTLVSPHPDKTIEINKLDSATESDVHHEVTTVSNVHKIKESTELWSLQPPDEKSSSHISPNRIRGGESIKKASEHRKKSSRDSGKHAVSRKKRRRSKMDLKEGLQWAVAIGALALASVFFYLSFSSDRGAVATQAEELANLDSQKSFQTRPVAFEDSTANSAALQASSSPREIPHPILSESTPPEQNPPPQLPTSLPQLKNEKSQARPQDSASLKASKKKILPVAKAKKETIDDSAKVEKKSNQQSLKPGLVKTSRAKTTAPTAKPSSSIKNVTGSAKEQSFYKHRERKALFYSALKAETLALEIQENHQKLSKNQRAWKQYYTQWRQKVRSSVAKKIRDFPVKGEVYAYPQALAAFKKDYEAFFDYGDTLDRKTKGQRVPSDAPQSMREIFSRHRKLAQSLGQ